MACETRRSIRDVAQDPYHLTLWTYAQLLGADYREQLRRRGEQLQDAANTAVAFHDPKKLETLGRNHDRAIGLEEPAEDVVKKLAGLISATDQIMAQLDEAERNETAGALQE